MAKSVYIHIPFCAQICHYCDFNKFLIEYQPVDAYLDALDKEMDITFAAVPLNQVNTIFIGGGTPTALPIESFEKLLQRIKQRIPMKENIEYTIEANPNDISEEYIGVMKQYGVNRLSIGVQSFDSTLLNQLGRTHTPDDVVRAIEMAIRIGIKNVSIDLMYGLPNQTFIQWKETVIQALAYDLPHYSSYSLIVEPKTVFYQLQRKNKLPLPSQELEAQMYEFLIDEMAKNGLDMYEISNFSKLGYESKHNICYWENESYYGFGAGAHSYLVGERIANHGPMRTYLDAVAGGRFPRRSVQKIAEQQAWEEEMFLGLRMSRGVSYQRFHEKFSTHPRDVFGSIIDELVARDLLEETPLGIRLTRKGYLLGNEVFQRFLL